MADTLSTPASSPLTAESTTSGPVEKLSPVEGFKTQSHYLRGDIDRELTDGNDFFGKPSIQLLKNHGTYQQDDRDARTKKDGAKSGKAFSMMVRSRIPGGKLTSAQLLAELDIADQLGNSTLRITSRQGLQLHGIPKSELKECIKKINDIKLSTLAACGDVNRNVMCCPAPDHTNAVHRDLQELADALARELAPRTRAYYEIWLRDDETGEEQLLHGDPRYAHVSPGYGTSLSGEDQEPIYGQTYLPRKFKIAIATPEDNCVDLYAHDLSYLAIVEQGRIVGYDVLIGGGMGVTPSAAKTFPAVGKKLAFVTPNQAIAIGVAVVKVQRDHGNRADRKVARLKYTLANLGMEQFRQYVRQYVNFPLALPTATEVTGHDDHLGWREQGDGRYYYGLNVENGRIVDNEQIQLKSALREICRTLNCNLRLTAHQSILFIDLDAVSRGVIADICRKYQAPTTEEISTVRRWSMACVAKPTCGLAVAESERVLPGIIDQLEPELQKLGLDNEPFTLRMTGCPNGCARPYNCDIGLVGKTDDKYTIFVGGRLLGDRLNFLYKDLVPTAEVVATLVPLFAYFQADRQPGETLGDFFHRKGAADLLSRCGG
ncbi:MAG: NADPH-dependent assimilatory sulfite reductase hemoprotein subunit [Pirellulales bacterium]|nr:NADPH-dependent assimilatory sulfite reductase hemoprotein subunit [Pirellulales bacterium]